MESSLAPPKANIPQLLNAEQVELVKRTCMPPNSTNDELALFLHVCKRKNLDPLTRQIYAMRDKNGKLTFMTSIDGWRISSERSGQYAGMAGPFWCGEDGEWREIWTAEQPPVAAKVGVLRHDFKEPVWGKALWRTYAQKRADGSLIGFWAKGGEHMLAKCAESIARRIAFPDEGGSLYIPEEFPDEGFEAKKRAAQEVGERKIKELEASASLIVSDVSLMANGRLKIKYGKETIYTGNDDWIGWLKKAKGKPCILRYDENLNLTTILQIGKRTFNDNLPEVDINEDRNNLEF